MAKTAPKRADPAKVASNVYKKLMENELVRVFDVRFKPGDKAVMHWHPNHLVYVFEDGSLELSLPNGKTQKLVAKGGDTAWMDSGHHQAVNKGKSDMHALVVELKGSTKKLSK